MSQAQWPTNGEYVLSVSDPEWCFVDLELKEGLINPGPIPGVPECATGQNAIVFPVQCADRKWAVRCFTTPAAAGQVRYEAYSNYLRGLYCPPLVGAEWIQQGVRTSTGWWPIVKMEWVNGRALHQAVADALDDPNRLRHLASQWRETTRLLRHAKIAHGDLQHGNVLVDSSGELRLVDYDGIWIPGLADLDVHEVGHPNYQHPERPKTPCWDEYIDTFSALAIYTSLRALAADPTLWSFHNGENLIFTERDYVKPTKTEVWQRVHASADPDVVVFGDLLAQACRTTVKIATDLDEILTVRRIPVGAPYPAGQAPINRQWWDVDYVFEPDVEDNSGVHSRWGSDVDDFEPDAELDIDDLDPRELRRRRKEARRQLARQGNAEPRDWRVTVIFVLLVVAVLAATITLIIAAQN